MANVWSGVISGSTPKTVSPMRPLEADFAPAVLTVKGNPSFFTPKMRALSAAVTKAQAFGAQ